MSSKISRHVNGAGGLSLDGILRLNWGGHIAPDPSDGVEKVITIRRVRCARSECAQLCNYCMLASSKGDYPGQRLATSSRTGVSTSGGAFRM